MHKKIFSEFLGPNAAFPVNVDSKVMDMTNQNLENPGRWSFDEAAVSEIFPLSQGLLIDIHGLNV